MATYTRSKTVDFTISVGVVDQKKLWAEVETATTKALRSITEADDGVAVIFDFGEETLDSAQETALTTACNDHGETPLKVAKDKKSRLIDHRTRQLIRQGFTHGGKKFSLSDSAQLSLIGAFASRADLTFPIKWNTKDDDDTFSIADAPTFKTFFLAGLGTARAHLDSGTALKDSVRAATNIAEVDAVVDNR